MSGAFEVGPPNLMFVWVTLTLTSGLSSRIIMSRAYLMFGMWMHLWLVECHILFLGHCDLDI